MAEERKTTITPRQGPGHGPGGGGPVRSFEKPKNTKKVVSRLLVYLAQSKWALSMVVLLLLVSSVCMLAGNYFLKPLINNYILPGDFTGLAKALVVLAGIYLVGVGAMYIQSQIMVRIAQKTANTLRRDLFNKMQALPLRYFDTHATAIDVALYQRRGQHPGWVEQSTTQLISSLLISWVR